MLKFGNAEFRNLQEQVARNQCDIEQLKSGIVVTETVSTVAELPLTEEDVGKYVYVSTPKHLYLIVMEDDEVVGKDLGSWPAAGETGATGPTGATGATGRNPKIGIGNGPLPQDDDWVYPDLYIFKNDVGTTYSKGDVYQKNKLGSWQLALNITGEEGLPGGSGDEVIANPEGETATDTLETISIDGIVYAIECLSAEQEAWITNALEYIDFDSSGNVTFGNGISVDGDITVNDFDNILDSDGNSLEDTLEAEPKVYIVNASDNPYLNTNSYEAPLPSTITLVDGSTVTSSAIHNGDVIRFTEQGIPDRWIRTIIGGKTATAVEAFKETTKTYELIKTVTITEESAECVVDLEDNYSKLLYMISIGGTASDFSWGGAWVGNTSGWNLIGTFTGTVASSRYVYVNAKIENGRLFGGAVGITTGLSNAMSLNTTGAGQGFTEMSNIQKVKITFNPGTVMIPVGTTITVYGIE